MIKNGGNLWYTCWIMHGLCSSYSHRDTQASSKAGSGARVGSSYIVGGWGSESLHQLDSPAKEETPAQWCKQDTF